MPFDAMGTVMLAWTLSGALVAAVAIADELSGCRAIGDAAKRVACYDAVVDAMEAVPGEAVTGSASRAAGSSPRTAGPDDLGADAARGPASELLEAEVVAVDEDPYGKLIVELDNSQVWSQIDSARLRLRPGDAVRIEGAASGSYLLEKLPDSRLIRVTRLR